VLAWCGRIDVECPFIAPDKPMQNDYVESSNGRMRDGLLNETLVMSLARARVEVSVGINYYGRDRQHSSLGYTTSAVFAAGLELTRKSGV
jgi:transposase InsO family protein